MTLNSLSYFLFLPVVYLIFYFSADRWRWLVLLTASYGFYASFKAPYWLAVLVLVTCSSYLCGLRIAACETRVHKTCWFWGGCCICISILGLSKSLPYLYPLSRGVFAHNSAETFVSIGVSYFTIQAISYLADIYLEVEEPETHIGRFALYLAFFPKLLQGPVERAGDLFPQLKKAFEFDYDLLRSGVLLFAWGFFKKVAVADRMALYADQVYNNVYDYSGLSLIAGTYVYALQIYFDFSAYTDMAIGTGRIFGIELAKNFNSPYLATSIADFWRRWHISFSRWLLDYIFRPLQFWWRSWKRTGTAVALVVTFLISGVWHGASWNFVIWGALHGVYITSSIFYRPYQNRLHKWLNLERSPLLKLWQVFVTFNLVSLAWIFFRANSMMDAWYVITHLFSGFDGLSELLLLRGKGEIIRMALVLAVVLVVSLKKETDLFSKPVWVRWPLYYALILISFLMGIYQHSPFMYTKF